MTVCNAALLLVTDSPDCWQRRHNQAAYAPMGPERAIRDLLTAWLQYRDVHAEVNASRIGDDSVLGPEWARIGAAIRGLLNADCGRFDCGTLDRIICRELTGQGYDPDAENWNE